METMVAFVVLALLCGLGAWLVGRQRTITASPVRRGSLAKNHVGYGRLVVINSPRAKKAKKIR